MVAEQKRFKKRTTESFIFVLLVVSAVILTIGELKPNSGIPSWTEMFYHLSGEPVPEPSEDILMSVHSIDVGQGDSTLIRVGETTVLIDAGENGKGGDVLEYIDDLGIRRLDYVIATHPHSDHIGGLDTVMENIEIGTLIMPDVPEELIPTGSTYSDFLDAAFRKKSEGASVLRAQSGDKYELSEYAYIEILSPGVYSYTDLNDYSVAVLITCGDVRFFSAGDITHIVERNLMNDYPFIKADLMKVSHHGSETSNLSEFISMIDPDHAFISCGRYNDYGHPHLSVLYMLSDLGVEYRRTDVEGSVVYYTDGKVFYEG